jgi:hypothetical protein
VDGGTLHRLPHALRFPLSALPEKEVTVVKIAGTTLTLAAVIQPQRVPVP